jgi:hypothetical protein
MTDAGDGADERLDAAQLHAMLDELLADAEGSAEGSGADLDADAFWHFVTALAQGRGITSRLHEAGLAAVAGAPPGAHRHDRERRAYHIGLLARLVTDIGRLPGQPSILPGNFSHGVIAADLLSMLAGQTGQGRGKPLVLYGGESGIDNLRKMARQQLVGAIFWRMGRSGLSQTKVREALIPDLGKQTWDGWLRKFGGSDGTLAQDALEAGRSGQEGVGWAASDADLARVIKLAREGRGRRNR